MEYDLSFSSSSSLDGGTFKLLELPPDLCQLVENAIDNSSSLRLTIKGQSGEQAVLCTNDKTFAMRSVVWSNSVLIVAPPPDSLAGDFPEDSVVIRDQVNEALELVSSVPKLHKLGTLLKGREYSEGQEDEDMEVELQGDASKKWSLEEIRAEIQASDVELDRGLRERHILNINGELRPIAPKYLNDILEQILNALVSHSLSHKNASVERLSSSLADEHEIPRVISAQIMSWFGELREGRWTMDVDRVIKEIGLGILRNYKRDAIEKDTLLVRWKSLVGDTFESSVSLFLLSGNYLVSISPTTGSEELTYFPASSLPIDPAARFADLFLTRPRWTGDTIAPFLTDIAVNSKERDKLLLRFARATTDTQGVWYTARAQYNG